MIKCPTCNEADELVLEKVLDFGEYADGIFYCQRCSVKFQVELEQESEADE